MPENHSRPPEQGHLSELIELREKSFPDMSRSTFAQRLGISRMHLLAVERGRRRASIDLVLRWLTILPEARLDMFGGLPTIERRIHLLRQIQQISSQQAA